MCNYNVQFFVHERKSTVLLLCNEDARAHVSVGKNSIVGRCTGEIDPKTNDDLISCRNNNVCRIIVGINGRSGKRLSRGESKYVQTGRTIKGLRCRADSDKDTNLTLNRNTRRNSERVVLVHVRSVNGRNCSTSRHVKGIVCLRVGIVVRRDAARQERQTVPV